MSRRGKSGAEQRMTVRTVKSRRAKRSKDNLISGRAARAPEPGQPRRANTGASRRKLRMPCAAWRGRSKAALTPLYHPIVFKTKIKSAQWEPGGEKGCGSPWAKAAHAVRRMASKAALTPLYHPIVLKTKMKSAQWEPGGEKRCGSPWAKAVQVSLPAYRKLPAWGCRSQGNVPN
jgi:hypothetical protein